MMRRKAPINPIGHTGRLSEKRLGKQIGARATPASGAMLGAKGDLDLGNVLMEAKSTIKDSMTLHFDWLMKIEGEARRMGKTPALAISFVKCSGGVWPGGDWVMIPVETAVELFGWGK
jgi:hypothetical protein